MESEGDHPGRKIADARDHQHHTGWPGQLKGTVGVQSGLDDSILHQALEPLNRFDSRLAAFLDFGEMCPGGGARFERFGEDVGGFDRILDGVVDADSPDRRHDMGGVADQEQARLVPGGDAAGFDGEHYDLLPVG